MTTFGLRVPACLALLNLLLACSTGPDSLADSGDHRPSDAGDGGVFDSGLLVVDSGLLVVDSGLLVVDSGPLVVDSGFLNDGATSDPSCGEPLGGSQYGEHVLRFENETGSLRVLLVRRYVGPGVGESVIFALDRARIMRDGGCSVVTDPSALEYQNSHHNWRDVVVLRVGPLRYTLRLNYLLGDKLDWEVTFEASDANAQVLLPQRLIATGGPVSCSTCPHSLPVKINEVLPFNSAGWRDASGEREPWIELFNWSAEAVDLSGYHLSNDPARPALFTFRQGTMIGRHEYLVIAADGEPLEGPTHASFRLAADGGWFSISAPDGRGPGERSYGALAPDQSLSLRLEDDNYHPSLTPTPGGDTSLP